MKGNEEAVNGNEDALRGKIGALKSDKMHQKVAGWHERAMEQ